MATTRLDCPYCGDDTPVTLPVSMKRIRDVTEIRSGVLEEPAKTVACDECGESFYVLYRD